MCRSIFKVCSSPRQNWMDPIPEPCGTHGNHRMPVTPSRKKLHRAQVLIPKQTRDGINAGEQIEFTDRGARENHHKFTGKRGTGATWSMRDRTITRKQERRIAKQKEKMVVTQEVVREFWACRKFRTEKESRRRQEAGRCRGLSDAGGMATSSSSTEPACAAASSSPMTGHWAEVMPESMTGR